MKKRYLLWVWAFLMSTYLWGSIPSMLSEWDRVINKQYASNVIAKNSSSLFQTLKNSVMKEWPLMFSNEADVDSLLTLNELLNVSESGLVVPTQLLQQPSISEISYMGKNIGLAKVCVKNSSQGFAVGSKNIKELLNGMVMLESRIDTYVGDFTYVNHSGTQQVYLNDFCILLRTSS